MTHVKTSLSALGGRIFKSTVMSTVGFSALAGGVLLHGPGAEAALVTKPFAGDRTDGLQFNLLIEYNDALLFSVPNAIPPNPVLSGAGVQCSAADTTGLYVNGSCYVNTDGLGGASTGQTALVPWAIIAPFTGNPITRITGTITDPDGTIRSVLGFAEIGSFEGGVAAAGTPLIPHYISDNLINPDFLFSGLDSITLGKGLSQGGFVILSDDPEHQYQFFSNPTSVGAEGELAGCGSGTCLRVNAPAPLPILGAAAAFASLRKLRKFSYLVKSDVVS